MNSLLNLDISGGIISYANDTALYFSGSSWEEVKDKVVHGFRIVKRWLGSFKLFLNVTKTYYIAFCFNSTNRPVYDFIQIDNHNNIKAVSKVKYLGMK